MKKVNKIERLKIKLHPINYINRLENIDFFNINEDIRFYLKNYGIYNIKLKPSHYMLRLRVDGSIITKEFLEHVQKVTLRFNLKILLTSRAQIELHNIFPKDILNIYKIINKKILTFQTLTDNFRAIVTCSYDCVEMPIFCSPIIEDIQKTIINNPRYFGTLPRKFNTAIIGVNCVNFNAWGNDLLFALAKREGKLGFNIYVGGKNGEVAKSLNIFCQQDEVKEFFLAIVDTFIANGSRESRSKLRLHFLIQKIGIGKFRELIELKRPKLKSQGLLLLKSSSKFAEPYLTQRYGNFGELSNNDIQEAIDSNLELRLSPKQELLAIDFTIKKETKPVQQAILCAGLRYCSLSLWDIKRDNEIVIKLINEGISVGFSGCLKGCGKHSHSDIGLIGLRTNLYSKTEKALRVFIGATQFQYPTPSRLLFYSVPKRSIQELFIDIIDDFKYSGLEYFEEFSKEILNRYPIEFLQLWYILKGLKKINKCHIDLFLNFKQKDILQELNIELTNSIITKLSHRLWDKDEN